MKGELTREEIGEVFESLIADGQNVDLDENTRGERLKLAFHTAHADYPELQNHKSYGTLLRALFNWNQVNKDPEELSCWTNCCELMLWNLLHNNLEEADTYLELIMAYMKSYGIDSARFGTYASKFYKRCLRATINAVDKGANTKLLLKYLYLTELFIQAFSEHLLKQPTAAAVYAHLGLQNYIDKNYFAAKTAYEKAAEIYTACEEPVQADRFRDKAAAILNDLKDSEPNNHSKQTESHTASTSSSVNSNNSSNRPKSSELLKLDIAGEYAEIAGEYAESIRLVDFSLEMRKNGKSVITDTDLAVLYEHKTKCQLGLNQYIEAIQTLAQTQKEFPQGWVRQQFSKGLQMLCIRMSTIRKELVLEWPKQKNSTSVQDDNFSASKTKARPITTFPLYMLRTFEETSPTDMIPSNEKELSALYRCEEIAADMRQMQYIETLLTSNEALTADKLFTFIWQLQRLGNHAKSLINYDCQPVGLFRGTGVQAEKVIPQMKMFTRVLIKMLAEKRDPLNIARYIIQALLGIKPFLIGTDTNDMSLIFHLINYVSMLQGIAPIYYSKQEINDLLTDNKFFDSDNKVEEFIKNKILQFAIVDTNQPCAKALIVPGMLLCIPISAHTTIIMRETGYTIVDYDNNQTECGVNFFTDKSAQFVDDDRFSRAAVYCITTKFKMYAALNAVFDSENVLTDFVNCAKIAEANKNRVAAYYYIDRAAAVMLQCFDLKQLADDVPIRKSIESMADSLKDMMHKPPHEQIIREDNQSTASVGISSSTAAISSMLSSNKTTGDADPDCATTLDSITSVWAKMLSAREGNHIPAEDELYAALREVENELFPDHLFTDDSSSIDDNENNTGANKINRI